MCRRLDFNEEDRAFVVQGLNNKYNCKIDCTDTAHLSLCSGVLRYDRELGGREALVKNC